MKTLVLLAAATASLTAAAQAAPISGLYDTGVDGSGSPLADGSADTHYLVDGTGVPVVFSNGEYFVASDAAFIGAQAGGSYGNPVNTYTLDFSLSGFETAGAAISGFFSADNYATVSLNGVVIAQDPQDSETANFSQETAFGATSGFVAGVNVLSFTVTDTGPPSGLEVSRLKGTATALSAAPEPASWALMLAGVGLTGAALRTVGRRKASTIA